MPKKVDDMNVSKLKSVETPEQASARISERFEILEIITNACILGDTRAMIVSGPPGLGKTYTIEKLLRNYDPEERFHHFSSGYLRATALFKLLYTYRHKNNVLILDDIDNIFQDEVSLNLLKKACDTTDRRRLTWGSEYDMTTDAGESIPSQFDYEGSIIFVTNLDFDAMIEKNHKLSPHFNALISRSHYIDLSLKTRQDYLIRIAQVVREGLLDHLPTAQKIDVIKFIDHNSSVLRELSLRMAIKIGHLRSQGGDWQRICRVTCCKNL